MSTMRRKALVLVFESRAGKKITLRIPDPRANLTASEIQNAMNVVIANNLYKWDGYPVDKAVSAKVVETVTDNFDVVVDG